MKKIIYVGYYDIEDNKKENRNHVLAASNKINYILSKFSNLKYNTEVVSASGSKNKKYYKGKLIDIDQRTKLRLFPTLGSGNRIRRVCSRWLLNINMFFYLLKKIQRNQPVIVYHSLGYMFMISLLRKLKKFYLILELEEIYGDVLGRPEIALKEMKFAKHADAYIFPTELLNQQINVADKPYVLIHGTYQVEQEKICRNEYRKSHGWDETKIHCVYAGTFDPRKGGAIAAAAAAEYLPCSYHIHILGFGSEEDKRNMKDLISELAKKCECSITYDGLLSGEEYIRFIQSCDIGLSTQNPDAAFNATSFPSKILSYMANGLRVVSIRIPAIEGSAIGKYMYYYDRQTSEEIAKAIRTVNMDDSYDSRRIIRQLDGEFQHQTKAMLETFRPSGVKGR